MSRDPSAPPAGDPWTVRWFGAPWNAPCCTPGDERDTPSTPCLDCGLPFGADDQGLVQAAIGLDGRQTYRGRHLDCFLDHIGAPTGIRERGPNG